MKDIQLVGKISLWDSQYRWINELFQWSETCDFSYQWYETLYDKNQTGCSIREISFIFFLKENEVKKFKKIFPRHLFSKLRFERFNMEIHNYYQGRTTVSKHPKTP